MAIQTIINKFARAFEALGMITVHAADGATRKRLFKIYKSLSNPASYSDEYKLKLRSNGQVFETHIRVEDIFVFGEIFRERQYALTQPIRDNAFIIDAGANIGVSSLWFLAQYPNAQVHCFEPSSANFKFLKSNLGADPRAKLFQKALGKENGMIDLHLGDFGAVHSVVDTGEGPNSGTESVELITLSDHLRDHKVDRVDLLKLDVEGAELDALIGLGDDLSKIEMIIGEMHETLVDEAKFYAFLKESGFRISQKRNFRESGELGVHGFEAIRIS